MSQALWMRLREVAWSEYTTSSGNGERIPRLLQDISSRKIPRAIKATHMLWKLLCSEGLRPAAEPTIPFLIELSQQVTYEVKLEIVDILKSCSLLLVEKEDKQSWEQNTWISLVHTLPILRKIRDKGSNKGSADLTTLAESIIELLEKDSNRK